MSNPYLISIYPTSIFALLSFIETNYYSSLKNSKVKFFVVFFVLSLLSMYGKKNSANIDTLLKVKFSIYGALVYYLLSSNEMYSITSFIVNDKNERIVLHSIIYYFVILSLMLLPKDN